MFANSTAVFVLLLVNIPEDSVLKTEIKPQLLLFVLHTHICALVCYYFVLCSSIEKQQD